MACLQYQVQIHFQFYYNIALIIIYKKARHGVLGLNKPNIRLSTNLLVNEVYVRPDPLAVVEVAQGVPWEVSPGQDDRVWRNRGQKLPAEPLHNTVNALITLPGRDANTNLYKSTGANIFSLTTLTLNKCTFVYTAARLCL
jgi:hypothetical protein